MSTDKPKWDSARTYPKRMPAYESEAGALLAHQLARRRGMSLAALYRMLIREQARKDGLAVPED